MSANAAEAVLARIAWAVLGSDAPRAIGAFTLRPAQRRAVRAAERALQDFGGALIADAPGTGKTVLALAIAARYNDVLIIVPAAVREQWERAAERADVRVRLETLEGLSHGRMPQSAPLIIVDEAHHLRTPTTARYRAVAQLAMHRHLLLLSATPVVNSLRDRDALLALFLGERAADCSETSRASVILRLASTGHQATDVVRLPPLEAAADVPELALRLLNLPAPLPLADGAHATAIVRITLAMAWASSLAALDAALKRRMERGRTLDDQLAAGRWPSRDSLRAWILGDDATQLAFGFETPDAAPPPPNARQVLAEHLEAVRWLRTLIRSQIQLDTQRRAQALEALLAKQSTRRVVVLAQSAVTVRALYAALRQVGGVVAITGSRVHAAAGRWTRAEVLAELGPRARPYRANDPRGIRLLLATDILAEGVELQGASVLVHADPTWTPARLEQRVGRLAREGQRERVLVTEFAIPSEVQTMLQLRRRLRHKVAARVEALSTAESEALLLQRLQTWAELCGAKDASAARVAAVHAKHCGFLALLRDGNVLRLVAGRHRGKHWRIRDSPKALLRALSDRTVVPTRLTAEHVSTVRRLLRRWHRLQRGTSEATDQSALPESLLRVLRRRGESYIAGAPLSLRSARARTVSELLEQLASLRGRGVERLLVRVLREPSEGDLLFRQLRTICAEAKRPAPRSGSGRLSIEALLVLVATPSETETSGPALA